MSRTLLYLLLALPTAVVNAGETVEFYRVGDGLAFAVSDDGSTVVGSLNSGTAFAWTKGGGLTSIGGIEAVGANSDGSAICGSVSTPSGESAGRLLFGQAWEPFGGLGASGCDSSLSSGYDISSDGMRCVGLGWDGCSANAFLWEDGVGMAALPAMGTSSTRADTISGNGMVIGGWDQASNGSRRAAAWYEDATSGEWSEVLLLEGTTGNGAGYGEVNGSNGDGSILLGSANGSSTATDGAFVYREGSGIEILGMLPQNTSPATGGALDASEDGSIIIGFQREGFGGSQQFRASIWTQETGLIELKTYLNDMGANIPAAFTLAAGMSISDDGRVFCGWGYEGLFFAQEAWVAVIEGGNDCPADFDGDGVVNGADLGLLLSGFSTSEATYDLNGDGLVDGSDLGLFLAAFGPCN